VAHKSNNRMQIALSCARPLFYPIFRNTRSVLTRDLQAILAVCGSKEEHGITVTSDENMPEQMLRSVAMYITSTEPHRLTSA
jgi:hypothetical protein